MSAEHRDACGAPAALDEVPERRAIEAGFAF